MSRPEGKFKLSASFHHDYNDYHDIFPPGGNMTGGNMLVGYHDYNDYHDYHGYLDNYDHQCHNDYHEQFFN